MRDTTAFAGKGSVSSIVNAAVLYFDEVNKEPVVYHWTYKLDEISLEEAESAGIKSNGDIAS